MKQKNSEKNGIPGELYSLYVLLQHFHSTKMPFWLIIEKEPKIWRKKIQFIWDLGHGNPATLGRKKRTCHVTAPIVSKYIPITNCQLGRRHKQYWNLLLLSRPLLRLLLGDIGFVYPVMSIVVIGPSLPILRQRRWSLLYDVYWLDLMMVIVNR
jgi:hypothetical protein